MKKKVLTTHFWIQCLNANWRNWDIWKKILICNPTTKHHIQIVRARFVQERIILFNISLEWAVKYIFKDAFWEFVDYSLDCGWYETASDTKAKVTKEIMNCHICKSLLILLIWNILIYLEQLLTAQTRHRIQMIFFQLQSEILFEKLYYHLQKWNNNWWIQSLLK